jgi:hypothetical protein
MVGTAQTVEHPHQQLLAQVYALPPEAQQQILEQVTLSGKTDPAEVAAEIQQGLAQQSANLGQQTPVDIEQQIASGVAMRQNENSLSTISPEETAETIESATRVVLAMKDRGASPEEIEQYLRTHPGVNRENFEQVLDAVNHAASAQDFTLAQQQQQAEPQQTFTLGDLLGKPMMELAAGKKDEPAQDQPPAHPFAGLLAGVLPSITEAMNNYNTDPNYRRNEESIYRGEGRY